MSATLIIMLALYFLVTLPAVMAPIIVRVQIKKLDKTADKFWKRVVAEGLENDEALAYLHDCFIMSTAIFPLMAAGEKLPAPPDGEFGVRPDVIEAIESKQWVSNFMAKLVFHAMITDWVRSPFKPRKILSAAMAVIALWLTRKSDNQPPVEATIEDMRLVVRRAGEIKERALAHSDSLVPA